MDVLDFAMEMELQGKSVYQNLAASTSHPGFRTIFIGLAEDEQKHYEILMALKEGKAWTMTDSSMLEKTKNVFEELLPRKDTLLSDLHEDLDAYKLSLKVEADSVRLYEEMAQKEQDPETVQLLLRIANEEKKHFNIMENVCDFVMRPKYFLEWREFSNLHEL